MANFYGEKELGDYENFLKNTEFVWGIKSGDDLCGSECCLWTMNDFDILYRKDTKEYTMGVETIYEFDNKTDERKYIKSILDRFTAWMIDKKYDTQKMLSVYELFTAGFNINTGFDNLEDLYATFKIYANAFMEVK